LAEALGAGFSVSPLDYSASDEQKQDILGDANGVLTVRWHDGLPTPADLRLVQVPGVGCDEIDIAALPASAALCNVRGHGAGVAEYVVLQMLEWCYRLRDCESEFRTGSWRGSSRFGAPPLRELHGATVGIVGYGEIGRAIATRLQPFGVQVLVANRSKQDDPAIAKTFGLDRLAEMLAACDFAVVAIPLVDATRGLIGSPELTALGPTGVLVNIARGPVVDETALWTALNDQSLGGAIIDVWYQYPDEQSPRRPPSQYPFHDLTNVRMTPHIAGWTDGTMAQRRDDIADNFRRLATGAPFRHIVSKPRTSR
jgi:phosphoglycerate dehydrogenase-like enzyme